MSQPPLVSILINNYNYARFLGEAINSALHQTYPNIEIIVVDDGSVDDSREVISSFGDKIFPVFQDNGGQASALNSGFAVSKGDWIHLLDSDDLFEANKVQRVQELANEYPTAGMIAHDLEYCATNGDPLKFASPYILKRTLVDDRPLARYGKMSASLPATSGLCIRRDVAKRLLPAPRELRLGVDNYVKWVCLSLFPVLLVPEFLGKQRIHGNNAGTIEAETGGMEGRVKLAAQDAAITFHMKKNHPHLSKLAWKQYGRLLYMLKSSKLPAARAMENEIRDRYSVVDKTVTCAFYVLAAFTSAFVEDKFRFK